MKKGRGIDLRREGEKGRGPYIWFTVMCNLLTLPSPLPLISFLLRGKGEGGHDI